MLSAIVGLAVAAAGIWGMWRWWPDLFTVLRGILPLCFFCGGIIAVVAGLSSVKKPPEPGKPSSEKSG
jgi:hypothetical protein